MSRVFEVPYHGRSTLGRVANYGSFALSAVAGSFSVFAPDVLYVWHPPLTVGLAASVISWFRRAPFVYDLQDIWPESLVYAGLPDAGLVARSMRAAEGLVYSRASHIIVPTAGAKANLESKGVAPSKVTVLSHWANPEDFVRLDTVARARARMMLNARDQDFVVTFAGNLGFAQGLDTLLEAASALRDRRIAVRLIGDGAARDHLAHAIKSCDLTNVQLIGPRSREETASLLAASDALLVILKSRALGEIALPGKTMLYLAAGRPIIMAAGGAGANLVRAAGAGVVVEPNDAPALASAIAELSEAPDMTLIELGAHGVEYARAVLSRSLIMDQLESILLAAAAGG